MKSTDSLMRRLALADPAKNLTHQTSETSAGSGTAQALLHRIQSEPIDDRPQTHDRPRTNSRSQPDSRSQTDSRRPRTHDRSHAGSVRPSRRGRQFVLGAGALATAAAVTIAGVITMPWSHGRQSAAAYAVEQKADGSLQVTVHFDDLRDPSALNRDLAQHNAHTVVMARSAPGACRSSILTDPQHRMILHGTSEAGLQAQRRAQAPWLTESEQPEPGDQRGTAIFTIHPELVPAGDQLLVMYTYLPTRQPNGTAGSDTLGFSSLPVLSLPGCVPAAEDQVLDGRTGQIHPR